VRGHRQLQPSAEAETADRGDDRLGARLQALDEMPQVGIGLARGGAELADVGTAGKQAATAGADWRR
jgi:hypothetical protein